MTARIERIQLPESAQLRRALAARADSLHPGARVVDADVRGPTGVDLLLVDDDGRPVFVDVVLDSAGEVPTRIFDHTRWYEQNRRLFLKAYTNDGVVRIEDPVFVFVASRFPASVLEVVRAMPDVPVRLVRAEYFLIDGAAEVLLEDVTPSVQERISTSVARRTDDVSAGGESTPRDIIESDAVRTLLALFTSGVDGLDGRIATTESDEGISFRMGDRRLADVAVSPGSFTVSPGDGLINPIVVSDRVSLERALNSVVSLFVREERPRDGGNGQGSDVELADDERLVLSDIWGVGVQASDGS
ncbi:MAG: hypothetical protein KAJ04_00165 [Candidatus Eisenbacteria sp.]|jgi:hypothetical protein|nr:hypothetical protein [Candidatus Eisenbacteria bacterium]